MKIYKDLSKTEKKIFWGALISCLMSLFLLSPFGDKWLFSRLKLASEEIVIGKIVAQENDTRLRLKRELNWYKSHVDQSIHLGDSLFAGPESSLKVDLENQNQIVVGSNSLIVFEKNEVENLNLVNFQSGNFVVKVNGSMKFSVRGQVTEIKGQKSEVQVFMGKDQKPKLKLLKGKATFAHDHLLDEKLETNSIINLPKVSEPILVAEPEVQIPTVLPFLNNDFSQLTYTWKFSDIYNIQKNQQLADRENKPFRVPLNHPLKWKSSKSSKAYIEVATNSNFDGKFQYVSDSETLQLTESFIGENFWRVSFDDRNFSQPERFFVDTKFLRNSEPSVVTSVNRVPLISDLSWISVLLQSSISDPHGFVIQYSRSPQFQAESTRSAFSPRPVVSLSFSQPGRYFYRFQTVSAQQELSDWSKSIKFDVFKPTPPATPSLLRSQAEAEVGDTIRLAWQSQGLKIRIEISDEDENLVQGFEGDEVSWQPKSAGRFQARAWTKNQYGQESSASKSTQILVKDSKKLIAINRDPDSISEEASSQSKIQNETLLGHLNESYKFSKLSFSGFTWSTFSSQQFAQAQQTPYALGLSVGGIYWKQNQGIEAIAKVGLSGLNSSASNQAALNDLEARYHYRLTQGLPLNFLREFQVSLFVGFERYRNSGGGIYVNQYDLIKIGASLEFPLFNNWSGGGEWIYGQDFDQSHSAVLTGNLHYHFSQRYSIGTGYRFTYFESKSSPLGLFPSLPFRESMVEGFTSVDYGF